MTSLRRVAVLGAGTMGSRIAAHFANAGYPVELLDLVLPDAADRSAMAKSAIDNAAKQKPAAFFTDAARSLIRPGNFDDDLDRVRDCEWIIEAVAEDLAIKRRLWKLVAPLRQPGAIVSTNTSGLPLAQISNGFPSEFGHHFLGTHFFNPPRYLHLVEVIPGPETLPEVLSWASEFCDLHLGKGVVPCKDTPNFIANRLGSFFGATVHKLTIEGDYTIEEVDLLTGPVIGLPRSASFRLLDIVGIDVWTHVLGNLYDLVPHDPARGRYAVPPFMAEMVERGWLGEKSGQGFYKRVGRDKEIHAIDLHSLEYHPAARPRLDSVDAVKTVTDLRQRLRALVAADDRAGRFLWPLFRDFLDYSAAMVPEISDRIVEIDRAMRWGYNFTYGPFELWDVLGVQETAGRMARDGVAVPANVDRMLKSGARSFYTPDDRDGVPRIRYFDLNRAAYERLEPRPGVLVLSALKRARGVVEGNDDASLIDLGDGVLCLELRNAGDGALAMLHAAIERTSRGFQGLVLAGHGENFSAGANLAPILEAARDSKWEDLDGAVRRGQAAGMAIRCAPRPVVAAPFGTTVGVGCEWVLHAARVQASAETYMGLIDTSAGLVPAGGGAAELLIRLGAARQAFDLIAYARTSTSAAHAHELKLLRPEDAVSMNHERLIADAKRAALALAPAYSPGAPRRVRVEGESAYAAMKLAAYLAREGGQISEYDAVIFEKLACVLSGGRLTGEQSVPEQHLLDLEREAFLSLCGNPKTQDRMEHLLRTGKPLRN